jgi:hypothetical protein
MRAAFIFLSISIAVIIGKTLALDDLSSNSDEYLTTTVQGFIYHSDQSVSGNGFANIYRGYNTIVPDSGQVTLDLKESSKGSGNFNYNSSLFIQNRVKMEGYDERSTNWKIEQKGRASAVYAEMTPLEFGSFKSKSISSLWKDETRARNFGALTSIKYLFDDATAFSKESTIGLRSDRASYEDFYDSEENCTIASNLNLKANFNGIGQIDVRAGNNTIASNSLIDEYYSGLFSLNQKIDLVARKIIDNGDYDRYLKERPWLPCCAGAQFQIWPNYS